MGKRNHKIFNFFLLQIIVSLKNCFHSETRVTGSFTIPLIVVQMVLWLLTVNYHNSQGHFQRILGLINFQLFISKEKWNNLEDIPQKSNLRIIQEENDASLSKTLTITIIERNLIWTYTLSVRRLINQQPFPRQVCPNIKSIKCK